jgi:O-6-methylguanine DNA methyltransferase
MTIEDELAALRAPAPATVTDGALLATGLADGYDHYDSPLGTVVVAFNVRGVTTVDVAGEDVAGRLVARAGRPVVAARPPRGWDTRIGRAIERGTPGDLPLDLRSVTEFQRQVLALAAGIPRGEVRPYGWLARAVGRPGATRAVGTTMARNPVPLIIPCHRVVRSDGRLGAYSLGGAANKRRLLRHEGLDPEALEALARRGVRVVASDTTRVFCLPTCHQAGRIATTHRVEFRSTADAHVAGYRPCQACRPV